MNGKFLSVPLATLFLETLKSLEPSTARVLQPLSPSCKYSDYEAQTLAATHGRRGGGGGRRTRTPPPRARTVLEGDWEETTTCLNGKET
jgi:hypothetical protein